MVSREQIDQIRSAIDMADIIREYVPSLKASGRSVKGLCPFHSERTPSFHVHPEKGLYKCFGCGEAGDIIGFICKLEQVGFSEALEMLADRAGLELKKDRSVDRSEPEGIREKLYRVLDAARILYEEALWDEKNGFSARLYLEDRAIRGETAQEFHLGFAGFSGKNVFEELVKKGFSIELCQQAGLVSRSSAGRYYDPLFGRLVFPIFDSFGHTIGFGGRILPDKKKGFFGGESMEAEGPKYLNSPETPVFSKGKSLYGLSQAKKSILDTRRVVILEGYMDVIGVHQGGVKNAVATLGTAFTREHSKLLKRYADEIVAFFDPDEAGEKAALRSIEPMVAEELFARVVLTDEKGDPDEIMRDKGLDYFNEIVTKAPDFLDYMIHMTKASAQMPLVEKSKVATEMLNTIVASPNEILKSEWISRLAERLGLRVESLLAQVQKKKPAVSIESAPVSTAKVANVFALPSAEEELIQLLLSVPHAAQDLDLNEDDFFDARWKRLFLLIAQQVREKGQVSLPALCDDATADDRPWLLKLSLEERNFSEPNEQKKKLVRDIRMKKVKQRLHDLGKRLVLGQATTEEQEQYKELLRRVKGSDREPFIETIPVKN